MLFVIRTFALPVTKSIPSNSLAVGNPCKVLRKISFRGSRNRERRKMLCNKIKADVRCLSAAWIVSPETVTQLEAYNQSNVFLSIEALRDSLRNIIKI